MKKEEFIQKIAGYVKKYAAAYEIKVCSPILQIPAHLSTVSDKN